MLYRRFTALYEFRLDSDMCNSKYTMQHNQNINDLLLEYYVDYAKESYYIVAMRQP